MERILVLTLAYFTENHCERSVDLTTDLHMSTPFKTGKGSMAEKKSLVENIPTHTQTNTIEQCTQLHYRNPRRSS